MTQTLFITGTDTDAGKTYVACALLRRLHEQGIAARGYKPVASGCVETVHGWRNADALALIEATGSDADYGDHNPYAFEPAIAPHLAASEAGVVIDPQRLRAAHDRLAVGQDWVIAEGAGGWLTPLGDDLSLGDWVAQQGWPVLLVVEMRLGCLNHALLTVEAIQRRTGLTGWVANVRNAGMERLDANLASLQARLGPPLWVQRQASMAPVGALDRLFLPLEGKAALN